MKGRQVQDAWLLSFEPGAGASGELLFTPVANGENFRLEGSGDIYIGATQIVGATIIITPQNITIGKKFQLAGGLLEIQMEPGLPGPVWEGHAEYYEEIDCTLLGKKHLLSRMGFELSGSDKQVSVHAKIHFSEIKMEATGRGTVAAFSVDEMNRQLHRLRSALQQQLAAELDRCEQVYSGLEIFTIEENGHLPVTGIANTNNTNTATHQDIKGYMPGRYTKTKLTGAQYGYLPPKRAVHAGKAGYLPAQPARVTVNRYASGYLPQPGNPHTAPPNSKSNNTAGGYGQNSMDKPAAISINYSEIEFYAGRILCIKEMLRGIQQIQQQAV